MKETPFSVGRCWLAAILCVTALPTARGAEPRVRTNPPPAGIQSAKPANQEEELLELFKKEENLTNSLGMVMVWVPAGYRVGKCEVTQAEYEQVVGSNHSRIQGPRRPAERVSWTEAMDFCRRLTEKEQKAGTLPKSYLYALPTEPEWDYYVEETPLKDAITSYLSDRRSTEDVGSLPANKFGLCDVRGNVWEWCSTPVARGASWRIPAIYESYLAINARYLGTADSQYDDIGFRVVLKSSDASGR